VNNTFFILLKKLQFLQEKKSPSFCFHHFCKTLKNNLYCEKTFINLNLNFVSGIENPLSLLKMHSKVWFQPLGKIFSQPKKMISKLLMTKTKEYPG